MDAQEKLNEETYKIWKKNAPLLYEVIVTHELEWPTLTVQWFPDVVVTEGKKKSVHRVLLGTNTSGEDANYLQLASIHLPIQDTDEDDFGYGGAECKITIDQKIFHDGEVNKARYMPQKIDLIATKTIQGDVLVFDRTRFPSEPGVQCQPTIRLKGHSMEGYGLNWSTLKTGFLASASNDGLCLVYDIQQSNEPMFFKGHQAPVGDVAWNKKEENVFASVDDDGMLFVWDLRLPKPSMLTKAHSSESNSVDFCHSAQFLLATGSLDSSVNLFDLRNLSNCLHTIYGHEDRVVQVSFDPHHGHILTTASSDSTVKIWNLQQIGAEQTSEEAEDGPPELMFTHAGHCGPVSEIGYNLSIPYLLLSADENNSLHCWQVAKDIIDED